MAQEVMVRPVIEDPDILVTPTAEMKSAAAEVLDLIQAAEGENLHLQGAHTEAYLAPGLVAVIRRLCRYLADGSPVTIVPYQAELTTQAAANLLGISRTRLIQLIDRGDIDARREGSHRRLRIEKVVAFRDERSRRQEHAGAKISDLITSTEGGQAELEEARRRAAESKIPG